LWSGSSQVELRYDILKH